MEVYKNEQDETCLRGIRRSDVRNIKGKLVLTAPPPAGYTRHVMYLFKNDYIVVTGPKGEKVRGYYQSIFNINQNQLRYAHNNIPCNQKKPFTLSKTDSIVKLHIDILGRMGGEVKCGEPLSYLPEKS